MKNTNSPPSFFCLLAIKKPQKIEFHFLFQFTQNKVGGSVNHPVKKYGRLNGRNIVRKKTMINKAYDGGHGRNWVGDRGNMSPQFFILRG